MDHQAQAEQFRRDGYAVFPGVLEGELRAACDAFVAREDARMDAAGVVKNIADKSYSTFLAYGAVAGLSRFVPRDDSRYFGVTAITEF